MGRGEMETDAKVEVLGVSLQTPGERAWARGGLPSLGSCHRGARSTRGSDCPAAVTSWGL